MNLNALRKISARSWNFWGRVRKWTRALSVMSRAPIREAIDVSRKEHSFQPHLAQGETGTRSRAGSLDLRALCFLPALTACASTSLTETEDRIVLHHGYGGHLQSTEAVYEDIEAAGKPVVIDGHLHSADAFYGLGLPEVCYTPNASVSLHAVSWLGLVPSAKHTGRMASGLPGPVEAWFRGSMAFHDPIGWSGLSADELGEIWPDGRC